jgi:hypothetical protein
MHVLVIILYIMSNMQQNLNALNMELVASNDHITNKVPHEFLHHIPIILHFERLFRCQNIAQFIDYLSWKRSEDGVM